jgi:hypothetical protein
MLKTAPHHGVHLLAPDRSAIIVMFLLIAVYGGDGTAQSATTKVSPDVDVTLLSAEIMRFPAPIRLGAGPTAIAYQEALVLKLRVDRQTFDALPPSMEPYLYIGRREFRIFHIDRVDNRNDLTLTIHIQDWKELDDGAPLVLTIDHGAPVRDPGRYARVVGPRFNRSLVVDKRPKPE